MTEFTNVDEYLSDVPSHQSCSVMSEISQDFVKSTKALEQQFKEKYKILKHSYDKRIQQLSETIVDTCNSLISDEIIHSLKQESTSLMFIPAHIKEIIENHLQTDREKQLQDILMKLHTLENDLNQSQSVIKHQKQIITNLESSVRKPLQSIEPVKQKVEEIQRQYDQIKSSSEKDLTIASNKINELENKEIELHQQLIETISELEDKNKQLQSLQQLYESIAHENKELKQSRSQLIDENKSLIKETYSLNSQLQSKLKDIEYLERSNVEYSKDFSKYESLEQLILHSRDQQLNQIQSKYENIQKDYQSIMKENYELKSKIKYYEEDISRYEKLLAHKTDEETKMNKKMSSLVNQIESMMSEEANASTETIKVFEEKISELKHSTDLEMQKDKRLIASLNEEIVLMRSTKEMTTLELKHLNDENKDLRNQIKSLTDKFHQMTLVNDDANKKLNDQKLTIKEIEQSLKRKEDECQSYMKRKDLEIVMIEEKIKLQYEKKLMIEIQAVEQRYSHAVNITAADNDTLRKSVELIRSSLEFAPNIVDKTLEAQHKNLQKYDKLHQHEQSMLLLQQQRHEEALKALESSYEDLLRSGRSNETTNRGLEELKQRLKIIDDSLRQAMSDQQSSKDQIEVLRKQLNEKELEISAMKSSMQSERSQSLQLLNDYRDEIIQLKEKIRQAKYSLSTSTDSISFKDKNYHDLKSQYNEAIMEISILQEQLNKQQELHEQELKALNNQLEQQRLDSLDDQQSYNQMLENMRKKFESLVQLHDQSIHQQSQSFISNPITSDEDTQTEYDRSDEIIRKHREEIILLTQRLSDYQEEINELKRAIVSYRNEIQMLSNQLGNEKQRLDTLNQDKDTVHQRNEVLQQSVLSLSNQLNQSKELLNRLNYQFRSQLNSMRFIVQDIKRTALHQMKYLQEDINVSSNLIGSKISGFVEAIVTKLKSSHEKDLKTHLLKQKNDIVRDLHQSPPSEDSSTTIDPSVLNVLSSSPSRRGLKSLHGVSVSKSLDTRLSFPSSSFDSHLNKIHQSAVIASNPSFVNSIDENQANTVKIKWYDGFIDVIFDCLVSFRMMTSQGKAKIINLMQSFLKTSLLEAHSSRQLTSMKWIITEELQRSKPIDANNKQHLSEDHDKSKQEHLLLLELSKLEMESQISHYEQKIQELTKQLENERFLANQTIHETEKRLRRAMDESIVQHKYQDQIRLDNMKNQLEDEENKRIRLQNVLKENEKHYKEKIREIEDQNLLLHQQIEEAELKIARLKVETLHNS